jgi:hypothetical protein
MTPPNPMSFPPEGKKEQAERSALLRELEGLKPPPVLKPGVVR